MALLIKTHHTAPLAQCISPFYKKDTGLSFPCGKCYPCKARRVSGWSFRIQKEAERSDNALFVTLTYSNDTVPLTKKGYMTLTKRDITLFIKRVRKHTHKRSVDAFLRDNPAKTKKQYIQNYPPIKYYLVGEYGTKTQRPHYHLILFNAEYTEIEKSWTLGEIHYGTVTAASAAYTLKYISKDTIIPQHPNDDRQPEFSHMSKGLGSNYLTPNIIQYHRQITSQNLERFCITLPDGIKIAIPRYYKQKIWQQAELQRIGAKFQKQDQDNYNVLQNAQKLELSKKEDKLRKHYSHINGDTRHTSL